MCDMRPMELKDTIEMMTVKTIKNASRLNTHGKM